MNSALAPYIEQLLYTNDTVVIPGLGAFVAQPAPSAIDYAGGSITPPSKALSFNENLTTDDGLLTYAIVNERHISDEDARQWIDERVTEMQQLLAQREIVALQGIGRLYKNYVQKIQFLPDAANFSRDNFGLPPIQFSPLSRSREVTEPGADPVQQPAAQPQPARQETNNVPAAPFTFSPADSGRLRWPRVLLTVSLLALSGMIGYWFLQRQKVHQKTAVQLSTENAKEETPATEIPAQKEEEQSVVPAPDHKEKTVKKAEEPTKEPAAVPEKKPVTSQQCTAVLGMFKDPDNIARLKKQLQNNGFGVYAVPGKGGAETIGATIKYNSESELQASLSKLKQLTGVQNPKIKK